MNQKIRLSYARSVVAALLMLSALLPAQAQSPATRESLVQMFANIENGPKWKMSGDMLWGYFFTNQSRKPLESAAKDLSKLGYRVVAIYLSDKDKASDPDLWWLHVERVETHSIDSLDRRNNELATFANKLGLTSYDGMDVGPVSGKQK